MEPAEFNALIDRAKKKDDDAVVILSKYCLQAIKMHLSVKFKHHRDTEDWASDIFTYKILGNLPDQYVNHPLAWLYKISDNYVYTQLKRNIRSVELHENISDNGELFDRLERILVSNALDGVKEIDYKILVLRYYYGYKFKEIAEMLGLSPANVRQRASRARKIFKKAVTF